MLPGYKTRSTVNVQHYASACVLQKQAAYANCRLWLSHEGSHEDLQVILGAFSSAVRLACMSVHDLTYQHHDAHTALHDVQRLGDFTAVTSTDVSSQLDEQQGAWASTFKHSFVQIR